jgi:hypothetical protein
VDEKMLIVEYDRAYRNHTCHDTTLLRRVGNDWKIQAFPGKGMSSYHAADLIGFVWEPDGWVLYISAGDGNYTSNNFNLYSSRDVGMTWN